MGRSEFSLDDWGDLLAPKSKARPLTAAEKRAPKRKLLLKKKKKGLRKKISLPEYMLDLPAVAKKKVILGNDGTPATQETDFSLDDWASLTMAEIETVKEQALAASRRENKIFGPDSLKLTRSRSRLKALGFGTPAKKSRKFRDLVKRTMSPAAQKRASLATRRELRRMKTAPSDFPLIADRHRNRLARALKRERITIQGEIIRKLVDGKKQFIVRAVAAEAPMVELLVDSLKLRTPVVIEIVDEA